MRIGGFFIFLIGLFFGIGGGWLLHNYPDEITTEGTYCRLSGARLTVTTTGTYMGGKETNVTTPGALAKLMFEFNGDHPYEWVLPPTYLPPTRPEPALHQNQDFRNELMKHKLRDIEYLNHWPEGLAILYGAMENNSFRAVNLVQQILDDQNYIDVNVLRILDRPGAWTDRWSALDAFMAAYHCKIDTDSIRCAVTQDGEEKVLFLLENAAVENMSIDWSAWPSNTATPKSDTDVGTNEKSAEPPEETEPGSDTPSESPEGQDTKPSNQAEPAKTPAENQN